MTPSQTFQDHISELRWRIAWLLLAAGGGTAAGYLLRKPVIAFLQRPLHGPLFYSSPAGSFNFILKTSSMLGLMIALPLIVYHLIRFVEPALPQPLKRRLIASVIVFSTILAALGAAFGFFIIVPTSLHFFAEYSSATIRPLISADEYLSYVLSVLVTFALLFQIPLVVLFINRVKPLRPRKLLRYQRHVVVSAFVLAVILPFTYDPITQFVMAIPIVFLFYLSVILLWIANRKVVYPEEPAVEPEAVVTAAPLKPRLRRPVAVRQQRALPAWQSQNGGLKSAQVLKTAVDVLKPGTISRRPLKLDAATPIRHNHLNTLDLSQS